MEKVIEQLADTLTPCSDNNVSPEHELPANLQNFYRYFLSLCDGGYSKDGFFHFFGQKGPQLHNLRYWNQTELWKKHFAIDEKTFVFAEDIFGTQFCFDVRGNRRVVKMLIPDGGKLSLCANTFEEFLKQEVFSVESNFEVRQMARSFFLSGKEDFRPFTHIACLIPVSLGGKDTDMANLHMIRSSTNLKILGQIREQIKNLSPGIKIRDVKIDYEKEEIKLVC